MPAIASPVVVELDPWVDADLYREFEKLGASKAERSFLGKACYCESDNRQYGDDGKVLVSGTSDRGICQINQVHSGAWERMGLDVDVLPGNAAFALYLYRNGGERHWKNSSSCWDKPVPGW